MTTTWTEQQKSGGQSATYQLLIDDASHFLLIDDANHTLLLQDENPGIVWTNQEKS